MKSQRITRRRERVAGRASSAMDSLIAALACAAAAVSCVGAGDDAFLGSTSDGRGASDSAAGDTALSDGRASDGPVGDVRIGDGGTSDARMGDGGGGEGPAGDATLQEGAPSATSSSFEFLDPPTGDVPTIAFGMVGCGDTNARVMKFRIKNTGTGLLPVAAKLDPTVDPTRSRFELFPEAAAPMPGAGAAAAMPTGDLYLAVKPGETGVFSIRATVIRSDTAATTIAGSLNMFLGNQTRSIRLFATASGATLASDISTTTDTGTTAGSVPPLSAKVGTSASPVMFTLRNAGTASVKFTIAGLLDPEFSLADPMGTAVMAGGSSFTLMPKDILTLSAGFRPTSGGGKKVMVSLDSADAICGASLSTLNLTGYGLVGSLEAPKLSPFLAKCGGDPPGAQPLTLMTAPGAADVTVTSLQFDNDAGFGFLGATPPFTIPGNGGFTSALQITAPPFPPQTGDGGPEAGSMPKPIVGNLIVTTDADLDAGPKYVALEVDPLGASLTFRTSLPPILGSAVGGDSGTLPFGVINSGKSGNGVGPAVVNLSVVPAGPLDSGLDATLAPGASAAFAFAGGAATEALSVPTGANGADAAVSFTPAAAGYSYADIVMNVDPASTPLCANLPPPLLVTGLGSGLSVSPATLTFDVPCNGTTPTSTLPITVTNTTNAGVTWTIGGIDGGAGQYGVSTVFDPDGGAAVPIMNGLYALAPDASATVMVAITQPMPSALTPDGGVLRNDAGVPWRAPSPADLAATLTIGSSVGDAVVALQEIPVGDQLSVTLTSGAVPSTVPITNLAFGDVVVGSSETLQVAVTNSANPAAGYSGASVSFASSDSQYDASVPAAPVAAEKSAPLSVTFTPKLGESTATLQIMNGTATDPTVPLCAPLPTIALSGRAVTDAGDPVVEAGATDASDEAATADGGGMEGGAADAHDGGG